MASFPYGFACFGTQIPQNSPGALRAPGCLISLYFCMFWIPNTLFFPARFARRIASVSYVLVASGAQILQKIFNGHLLKLFWVQRLLSPSGKIFGKSFYLSPLFHWHCQSKGIPCIHLRFTAFGPGNTKKNPARFARRIASFPYVLCYFLPHIAPKLIQYPMVLAVLSQIAQNSSGALRAPECLIKGWV